MAKPRRQTVRMHALSASGADTKLRGRASWHRLANALVGCYLAATIAATALQTAGSVSRWLVVHILLLGAVTNAIVVWTRHFAMTLLTPQRRPRRLRGSWLALLNVGVIAVLAGVEAEVTALTIVGAALVAAIVAGNVGVFARATATARAGRFAPAVRFYWVAGVSVACGIAAGVALSFGVPGPWFSRVFAAHLHLNVTGWVALTVLGTEFALWPMVLRTRAAASVETAARHALVLCAVGLAAAVAGMLAAERVVAGVGLVVYLAGVARSLDPFARTAFRRPPRTPAAWMLAAGTGWLLVALIADLVALWENDRIAVFAAQLDRAIPWVLAGFVLQVLLGAMTYLVPVVVGGGPAGGRRCARLLERWGLARSLAFNGGVALVALPLPAAASVMGWWAIAVSVAMFVVLLAAALVTSRTTR